MCEEINLPVIADSIKETVSELFPSKRDKTKTHSLPSIKWTIGFHKNSDSDSSYESGKPSKSGKENPRKRILQRNLIPRDLL